MEILFMPIAVIRGDLFYAGIDFKAKKDNYVFRWMPFFPGSLRNRHIAFSFLCCTLYLVPAQ